jgi:hypothetical protein
MGQKQAAYDASNQASVKPIIGFYDSVDSPSPQGVLVVDISAEEWQYCIDNPGARGVKDGALVDVPPPSDAEVLAAARATQKAVVDEAYAAAVQADVTFTTAAGVSCSFQADANSQDVVLKATQGYRIAGATPSGFYWKAADNSQVSFTLADLEGLYTTILAQGWAAFQKRTTLKAEIDSATTDDAVRALTW